MKKGILLFLICLILGAVAGCNLLDEQWSVVKQYRQEKEQQEKKKKATTQEVKQLTLDDFVKSDGETIEKRIMTPAGYKREKVKKDSLDAFTRQMKLKPDKSKIMLYNGKEKKKQDNHVAVLDLKLDEKNLQQSCSTLYRVLCEYMWANKMYDQMNYKFGNGFEFSYNEWLLGKRLNINGNQLSWQLRANPGDSYDTLLAYQEYLFCYTGLISLKDASTNIELDQIATGDFFLNEKKKGKVVMVIDTAKDKKGNACFLLAQGGSPAQDIEILKNPYHPENPWYYQTELQYPMKTPEVKFGKNSLRRWNGFIK